MKPSITTQIVIKNRVNISLLPELLIIDNPYFSQMVSQIYPTELQLNMTNPSDTEASLFGLKTCPSQIT